MKRNNASEHIDFVIPVYNEGQGIYANMFLLTEFLTSQNIDYRLILVDDGSRDNSFSEILRLCKENPKIKALSFSRNFGKEAAICAGLEASSGDAVIVLDSDLQHPIEIIPTLISKWHEGFEIVEGVKTSRGKESIRYRLCSKLFYKLFRRLSGVDMDNSSDFKLMGRSVVNEFLRLGESLVFFRGMVSWMGFNRCEVPFEVQERRGDVSKFSTKSLFKMAFGAITSFSNAPLYLTNFIGTIFCIGAFVIALQTFYNYFAGNAQSGFTTVILLILISGGAILMSLGIIGIYISKIYEEVKNRPRFIVSRLVEGGKIRTGSEADIASQSRFELKNTSCYPEENECE